MCQILLGWLNEGGSNWLGMLNAWEKRETEKLTHKDSLEKRLCGENNIKMNLKQEGVDVDSFNVA